MKFTTPLVFAILSAHCQQIQEFGSFPNGTRATVYNIDDFGARNDNVTINTRSIQQAINYASVNGGGLVFIPPGGVYKTGTISLKSDVYLYLKDGSFLYGSGNVKDYIDVSQGNWDRWDVIRTEFAERTGILGDSTGRGTISGPMWQMIKYFDPNQNQLQPIEWRDEGCLGECRPRLVVFEDCKDVIVTNVHLTDSADWTTLFRRTDRILIQNNTIFGSQQWPNNDGLNLESVSNVVIRNNSVFTGDDAFVLSSGNTNRLNIPWPTFPREPVFNMLVENCTFSSFSSAIKFSAIFDENHSDIRDIVIRDVVVHDAARAIGFQQRSGTGKFKNISITNVQVYRTKAVTGSNWWSAGEAVWMTSLPQNPRFTVGGIEDITFENCYFESEQGIILSSRDQNNNPSINNIKFKNIVNVVSIYGNATRPGIHDFRPMDGDPSSTPTSINEKVSGYWIENARNVRIEGGSIEFRGEKQPFWKPGQDACLSFSSSTPVFGLDSTRCTAL